MANIDIELCSLKSIEGEGQTLVRQLVGPRRRD